MLPNSKFDEGLGRPGLKSPRTPQPRSPPPRFRSVASAPSAASCALRFPRVVGVLSGCKFGLSTDPIIIDAVKQKISNLATNILQ